MPRKMKTAFTATDEDVAITGIHDIGFIPRERDGVRGVEIRVGGGTSIMPRVAPTLYEFVELDNGDYLKVTEAVFRIFDRQDWLRVNRARARIKVLIDKIGIDAFREMVDEELEGDWVDERDFSIDHLPTLDRRGGDAPAPPADRREPERRPLRVRRLPRRQRAPAAPGRLLLGPGQGHPRRPDPGAVPRPRPDHARVHAAATRARPSIRTSSCAGCATSPLYDVYAPARGARPGRRRSATRSPTSSAAPAPTAASSGSPPRWASTRRSRSGSSRWRSPIR